MARETFGIYFKRLRFKIKGFSFNIHYRLFSKYLLTVNSLVVLDCICVGVEADTTYVKRDLSY